MAPEISQALGDNDLLLLTKDHPHADDCRVQLHALGVCEGREGSQSLRVRFFLSDDSQAGKQAQLERCARGRLAAGLQLLLCRLRCV